MEEGKAAPSGAGGGPALPLRVIERKPCGCQVVETPRGIQTKPCLPCAIRLAGESARQTANLIAIVAKLQEEAATAIQVASAASTKAAIDAALRGR